jgi:hypothetical protein
MASHVLNLSQIMGFQLMSDNTMAYMPAVFYTYDMQ